MHPAACHYQSGTHGRPQIAQLVQGQGVGARPSHRISERSPSRPTLRPKTNPIQAGLITQPPCGRHQASHPRSLSNGQKLLPATSSPQDRFLSPLPVSAVLPSRSLHLALQNILSKVKHQAPRQDALTSVSVEMQLFRGNGHRPMASRLLLSSPPGGRVSISSSLQNSYSWLRLEKT